ncbi:hypothetical protein [Streptomyces violaceorubidus]|uniref:hypothetical protein n=1 Tax=Streptomyces violaceorubidus TaxID=284042 RepID=UPI000ADE0F01|nr:hypothetical protein [Streptomyces violaceorubidus]
MTIVGIIVMIVGGPLGWLVFAAALVVMADTIRKVIKGEAGWGDLLWAALDCIPATKGFTSLAKLGKLWKAGGLKALGAGFMKGIGGGLLKKVQQLRSGGRLRGIYRPFKGSTRPFGGTIPYRVLTPKARQLARYLTKGPVRISPNEVNISHMSELQQFHGVEHAVVQNPAGQMRLFQGDEVTTIVPKELRDEGYKSSLLSVLGVVDRYEPDVMEYEAIDYYSPKLLLEYTARAPLRLPREAVVFLTEYAQDYSPVSYDDEA